MSIADALEESRAIHLYVWRNLLGPWCTGPNRDAVDLPLPARQIRAAPMQIVSTLWTKHILSRLRGSKANLLPRLIVVRLFLTWR
jgi:hypothetical protein